MKGNKYLKILAKIQVSAIFYIGEILGKIICSLCLWSFVWRRHVSAHPDGGQKPTEKAVIEFCYESVISFLRELIISIKVILFLIQ